MKNNTKLELEFNQKKINHIFHYTNSFDVLMKILRNGFAPSYCDENINDLEYFIPMVSFCNIPLKDVDLYMRYGKYGAGMSLEWAIKNKISPVIYIHENTPFNNLHYEINALQLSNFIKTVFNNEINKNLQNDKTINEYKAERDLLQEVNKRTVPILQFFKNWKTTYKNKEIITYQEREWRYVPSLMENEKNLITSQDDEFIKLKQKQFKTKPHLPQYSLNIDSLSDLKYIIIRTDEQRNALMSLLEKKFTAEVLKDSILRGKFMILTEDQIKNDF